MRKVQRVLYLGVILVMASSLSGCWLLAAGGAGAYGGYKMKEEGYTVQNPVTKEKSEERKATD